MALVTVTLAFWRHASKLDGSGDEKIKSLEKHEWKKVNELLADLVLDIEETLTDNGNQAVDRECITEVIDQKINREELEELVASHQNLGQSRQLYQNHRKAYEEAFTYFGLAAIFALGALLAGTWSFEGEPLGFDTELVVVVLGLGSVMAVTWGIRAFQRARRLKNEFNRRWQEYKFEY